MIIVIGQCYSKNKFPWNIGAKAIRFFQKTKYSHYYGIYINPLTKNRKYFDSTMFSVRDQLKESFESHYDVDGMKHWEVELNCTPVDFVKWFERQESKGYGFLTILHLAIKIILSFIGIRYTVKSDGLGRLICNELCLAAIVEFTDFKPGKPLEDFDLNETTSAMDLLVKNGIAREVHERFIFST
jgi:hypothetical protein